MWFINTHSSQQNRISGAGMKALSGLEDVLETVSLEMMMKSVEAGTHSKSWRERVAGFRSCITVSCGR